MKSAVLSNNSTQIISSISCYYLQLARRMATSCNGWRSVLAVSLLLCLATLTVAQTLPQQEIDAINAFRATVDPEPSQWSGITDPCQLEGISCNQTAGAFHVLSITLWVNIPTPVKISVGSWIGSLPYLSILNLDNVNFTSPISSNLASLTNFASLTIRRGYNVQLPTNLPASITSLFIMDCNDFTKMPNLAGTSLAYLTIESCPNLSDTIPAHYASMTTLKNVNFLSLPGLTGSIPKFSSSLYILTISSTGLSGTIPALSVFQALSLSNNAFTGPIPGSIFTSTIATISLSRNKLSGTIPSQISTATSLTALYLGQNQLSGNIPQNLFSLPLLNALDLNSNNFSGNVPDFGQMNALVTLDLSNNQFTGSVPVFRAPKLRDVKLADNQLSGTIPAGSLAVKSIQTMDLGYNKLSGTIPQIGSYLTSLTLDGNQLTGSVPFTDGLVLNSLSMAYNQLTGSIPMIGSSISVFSAQGNQLTGFLPTVISKNLLALFLADNQFYGEIPSAYSDLKLLSFDLSNNLFSGCFNLTFPALKGCSLSKNFFCCVPEQCQVSDIDCPNCPSPVPDTEALCQYDKNRTPTWVIVKDLVINNPITVYNTIVFGNLDVNSNISISGGSVIDVKGCADVSGSLTVQLTPEEIQQLAANGTLTRDVIKFNSTCSNVNLDFDEVSYQGDLPCTNTTIRQQNTASSIAVIITSEKIPCPGDLQPWAIGVIVAACVVAAGAAIGIGLGVTQKKKQQEQSRMRSRLSSAGSVPPKPTSSAVELEHESESGSV